MWCWKVGCGSGTNFNLYDEDKVKHLHAIEPAEGMVKRARSAWAEGRRDTPCDIHCCGAEAVPLDDNSVDTAVVTFVLCTIPDWESSLTELRRVLKPGGKVLFSEHGLAPDEGVAKWQRRIEPVWKRLAGGCHLTRDTQDHARIQRFQRRAARDHVSAEHAEDCRLCGWGTRVSPEAAPASSSFPRRRAEL